MSQGYLKGLLCSEGKGVVNLFLPPVAVEEGVADDSGAGEARVKVESDLVSGITEQINFKPKTGREMGWRAVKDASGPCEPAELGAEQVLTCLNWSWSHP